MRKTELCISEESHRNPSHSKVHRNFNKTANRQIMPSPSGSKVSKKSFSINQSKEKAFLHKCFEQVYLQNIALNQQIARKKKQYAYLVFESQRMKKGKNPTQSSSQRTQRHQQESMRQKRMNKQKSSLSSIQSIEDSSLISEKFVPIEETRVQVENEWQRHEGRRGYLEQLKFHLEGVRVENLESI